MSDLHPQRVIAIVGRPNVGKSALFNRLVGRRVAIVHEQSGVTRDRLSCEAIWNEERFELIDTGGMGVMDGEEVRDPIAGATLKQVQVAIEDASVVLFVVDITADIVPLDREVARLLHESGRTVFIAANKADHAGLDQQASAFDELGFPAYPISALHNRGITPLMQAAVSELPDAEIAETTEPLRIAVVGRPNVGKSSYINRLLKSERVIVSEVPGTTRDSIEVPFTVGQGPQARHYLLIDTAGMRKTSSVKEAVDKFSVIRTERSIERADVVILMLDATEGPKRMDKRLFAKIEQEATGCFILVNKWDLAGEVTQRAYGAALREALPFAGHIPILFTSAKSGFNIRKTIEAVGYVAAQINAQLTTGLLNRVIHEAVHKVQPPVVEGRRLKIYYATQVGTKPIRIRLFVNAPRRVKAPYKSYLLKSIRKAFGLEGAPILLQFRARRKDD